MSQIDISTLTPAQLSELVKSAEARRAEISAEHRESTRQQLTDLAKDFGYDIRELFGFSAKSKPAKARGSSRSNSGGASKTGLEPKYRDPTTGATWVGRGKRPLWVRDHVNAGGSLDDLLIAKAA